MSQIRVLMAVLLFPMLCSAQLGWFGPSVDPLQHWDVVLKINKAPRAQYMDIYIKGRHQKRVKVSTGREKKELARSGREYFSATPTGWYSPTHLVELHRSNTWETDMPWAVFIIQGIALHGVPPSLYGLLGTPASGGCIRLTMHDAKYVFDLVRRHGMGRVPALHKGRVVTDGLGSVKYRRGWKTVVILEN